jgi:hypothetical protein
MAKIIGFKEPRRATRISVTGNGRSYRVSVNGGPQCLVTLHRGEPKCACGIEGCIHIDSLTACGFVDDCHSSLGVGSALAA